MFVGKVNYGQYDNRHSNHFRQSLIMLSLLVPFLFESLSICCEFPSSASLNQQKISQSMPLVAKGVSVSNTNDGGGGERFRRSIGGCGPGELFSREEQKCFTEGKQGPCGINMIFVKTREDLSTGKCGCRPNKKRALIYHPKYQQCYEIFTQGPCESGLWLVIQNGGPACAQNPCLFYTFYFTYNGSENFVSYNDDCVELYKPSPKCTHENEIISLTDKGKTPACVKQSSSSSSITPLFLPSSHYIPCANGTILSYDNECQAIVSFDLDPS